VNNRAIKYSLPMVKQFIESYKENDAEKLFISSIKDKRGNLANFKFNLN
jgi:hypothetical protein